MIIVEDTLDSMTGTLKAFSYLPNRKENRMRKHSGNDFSFYTKDMVVHVIRIEHESDLEKNKRFTM